MNGASASELWQGGARRDESISGVNAAMRVEDFDERRPCIQRSAGVYDRGRRFELAYGVHFITPK